MNDPGAIKCMHMKHIIKNLISKRLNNGTQTMVLEKYVLKEKLISDNPLD